MTGLMTLLEDENGDVVMLALYNYLPGHLKGMAGMRAAARELPVGQAVAVVEPFYKVMTDGSLGVRVDNPRELVKLSSLSAADAAALQAEGRAHFQAARYDAAADCYRRALGRMPDAAGAGSELLVSTLLNAAISHHRRGDAARSLRAAAAAAALRPDSSKAHYRAAVAAAALGAPLAARAWLHVAFECMPGGGPTGEEWRRMTAELGAVPEVGAPPSKQEAAAGRDEGLRLLAAFDTLDAVLPQTGAESASAGAATATHNVDAAAAMSAASAAKEFGNAAFKEQRWAEALQRYGEAAAALCAALPAAALLANLAACALQSSQPREALAAATAAALLQPSNAKAHYRRAQAALALGWAGEAAAAVRLGLGAVGSDGEGAEALRELRERIATAQRMPAATQGGDAGAAAGRGGKSGRDARSGRRAGGGSADRDGGHLRERHVEAMKGPSAPVESTAMLNMMARMAKMDPTVKRNMEKMKREEPLLWLALQKDDRVPPFHTEFSKAGRWPPLCDVEACGRKLWDAYELCVGMGNHLIDMSHVDGMPPVELFRSRTGLLGPPALERIWWLLSDSTPDGAVSFRPLHGSGYNPTIFHSFSNAAAATVPMPPGGPSAPGLLLATDGSGAGVSAVATAFSSSASAAGPRVHVAVGFVDLGTLAAAVDLPEWDEHVEAAVREAVAAAARGQGQGPAAPPPPRSGGGSPLLRWVGYEASSYSVAKTLVLERMMRAGGTAATEHVLQVWFSSVWTRPAAASFRAALTDMLREVATGALAPPGEVLSYLTHWQLRDVGLAESRRRWAAEWTRTLCDVGLFKEKSDRLALSEYLLTGQLPGLGGGEVVGSVTMFANPKGGPERSLNESVLEALPQPELFAARMASNAASGSGQADLVSAGVGLLRRRVRRLAALLASGRVEVQVLHRCVEPGVSATAASIASLNPDSISWSNLPDYYHPRDFHALARACSRRDAAAERPPAAGSGSDTGSSPGPAPTEHHAHIMNWPLDVKGASHLDYVLPYLSPADLPSSSPYPSGAQRSGRGGGSQRPGGAGADKLKPPKELSRRVLDLLEDGRRAAREDLARQGGRGDALLFDPPVDNPRNVADFGLTVKHHMAWVDAFFAAGGLRRGARGCRAEVTSPPAFAPLSRTNTTLSLAFAYGSSGAGNGKRCP